MKLVRRTAVAGWMAAHGTLAALAVEPDARAEAPDRALVVYVEAGSDVDASQVRGAVAAELGVRVPEPGDPVPPGAGLLHVRSQGGFLRVTFRDARGRTVDREVAAPGEAHARATMIALLAGNLARNEADELVGVEPAGAGEEPPPPPAQAADLAKPASDVAGPAAKASSPVALVSTAGAAQNPGSTQRTLGWIGIGAGVVTVGIGAGLFVSGQNDLSSLQELCAPECWDSQAAPFREKRAAGTALVGAGALLGIGGTVALLTAPSGRDSETRPTHSVQRTAGWVAVAAGAVGLGTGVALRMMAASDMSQVQAACPDRLCSSPEGLSTTQAAASLGVASNWSLALGAAAAVTGVVLELTAPGAPAGTTVAVGPQGVRVGGAW